MEYSKVVCSDRWWNPRVIQGHHKVLMWRCTADQSCWDPVCRGRKEEDQALSLVGLQWRSGGLCGWQIWIPDTICHLISLSLQVGSKPRLIRMDKSCGWLCRRLVKTIWMSLKRKMQSAAALYLYVENSWISVLSGLVLKGNPLLQRSMPLRTFKGSPSKTRWGTV